MEFINDFLGDWHGMAEYYDCTGVYEANNRNQCEILARITYDEDAGELKPFVGAAFDGANQYNFKIASATEYRELPLLQDRRQVHGSAPGGGQPCGVRGGV